VSQLFSFFTSVTRPLRYFVAGLLFVSLGRAVVVNAQAWMIKQIVDTVSHCPKEQLVGQLGKLFLFFLCIGLSFISLFRIYDYLISQFVPRQKEIITLTLIKRMLAHSASFYQRHFAGNLTNKMNDITLQTPELIKIVTDHFTTCTLTLVLVFINMSVVSIHFAYALIIWLTLFMGGSLWMLFSNSHLAYSAAESRSQVIGRVVDILMNISSIRLFGRARHERQLLKTITGESTSREQDRDRFFMKLHFFQGASFWLFEIVCCRWLYNGLVAGTITPGGFILIFTLNLQILDQFWSLGKDVRNFWEKLGQMKQALKIIDNPEDRDVSHTHTSLVVSHGAITFDHVYFHYDQHQSLFHNKNIVIPGGQKVGLVGYSGSGKSTFINLILRLYDVQSGHIFIDGQDIAQVSKNSLYESIAVIPQESYLFNRSIMENIRYGRLDASDSEIYQAAQKAEIHDVIQSMPQGYQTLAGEKGMRLSGGQRQRVAIARAILKNAPIILLDEATSNLDALTEERVQAAFSALFQNKTVLIVAHRLHTLKNVDRVCVFDRGAIVQDGTHQELVAQVGLYQNLWASQSNGTLGSSETAGSFEES
jgi:ATP-binding cassette subfamily B protein